jgi:L-arabinose isomerase
MATAMNSGVERPVTSRPASREKPRIGLLLLTAEWFTQIGASQGSFRGLPQVLEQDGAQICAALRSEVEVVNPGVLATRHQVREAVALFKKEDVDLLVACQVTWGEDRLIIDAVQQLPSIPLFLWCYTPFTKLPDQVTMRDLFRSSGPVGALQASAPLKRLGKKFGFACGSYQNTEALRRIVEFSKASRTARELRAATVGVLPYRCDQMTGTFVDEFRLKKEIGPELKYISVSDYFKICEAIPPERVEAFVRDLKASYRIASEVTEAGLAKSARVSLGLADLVEKYNLDAVAIEDVSEELHRVLGLRPCLYVPALFARAVVSMEAEVGGAVALLMLKKLSRRAPMYTEIFTFDEVENCLLAGHAGIHDIELAESEDDILIEPDGEYVESERDSCWMRFRAKAGQVTLLSLFCDVDRFKMVIASGESLGGKDKLLGSPHAYIKLTTPLAEFFEKAVKTGMTQHWAVVHGDFVHELVALADVLGVDRVLI